MKIVFVGSFGKHDTGRGVRDGFIKHGAEVFSINYDDFIDHYDFSDRVAGYLKRNIQLPLLSEPANDLVLAARGARYFRRETHPKRHLDAFNDSLKQLLTTARPELLFLYHYHFIYPEVIDYAKGYGAKVFCFFPDDAFKLTTYTTRARDVVKKLDCVITTKSFNVDEFRLIGIPHVIYMSQGYIPDCHYPVKPTQADHHQYGGDVAFVGNGYDLERLDIMANLIDALPDVRFRIYGNHWQQYRNPIHYYKLSRLKTWPKASNFTNPPVICEEMSKVINTSKIILGLTRLENDIRKRDLHTSRSIEIPACGGFMLAPYTEELAGMFIEGHEAAYFQSFNDLKDKINYYLNHDEERIRIANAGYEKATQNYSYYDQAKRILNIYENIVTV